MNYKDLPLGELQMKDTSNLDANWNCEIGHL